MRTHILILQNKKGSFKDKTLVDNLLLSNQAPQYLIVYSHHLFFFFFFFVLISPTCKLIELILMLFFYLSCIPVGRMVARDGSQPCGLSSPDGFCTWSHRLDNRTSYTVAQEHKNDCQALAEGWSPELAQPCLGCILLGRVASPAQITGGRGWYKDVSTQGREQSHRPPQGTKEETHIFTWASCFALRKTYCSPASWFKTQ